MASCICEIDPACAGLDIDEPCVALESPLQCSISCLCGFVGDLNTANPACRPNARSTSVLGVRTDCASRNAFVRPFGESNESMGEGRGEFSGEDTNVVSCDIVLEGEEAKGEGECSV